MTSDRYDPSMSLDDVERIRKWHERAYESMSQRETGEVSYLGRTFTIPPQVFPITPVSELLGKAVLDEVRSTDRVLDMGTGCGVNAILAASRSVDVVGVDINPSAIEYARKNAAANGVDSKIDFHESDVFDQVEGSFDLIVFDPPFRWFTPRDNLEAAIADENYSALRRFMQQASGRLRDDGRILLFFGTSGDIDYLLMLIARFGFKKEVVSERELVQDDWAVNYYVYRLTA